MSILCKPSALHAQSSMRIQRWRQILAPVLAGLFSLMGAFPVAQANAEQVRTVNTQYGPVKLTQNPQRVVTLYEGALDAAYAVNVEPIGAITTRGGEGVASYMSPRAAGIKIVGTSRETNLEAVIALEPDIILASSRLPQEQYKLLSAIAPTLVPQTQGFQADNWIEESRFFARALNKEAEMDTVLATVDQRIDILAGVLERNIPADQQRVVLARWMPQGPLLMSTHLFSTGLLSRVGFTVDDAGIVKADRPHSSPLSQENLALMDADWLFMATLNQDGNEVLASARQSPAFTRLQVVKADRVTPVDGQLWTSASGPLAAQALLDDIEQVLKANSHSSHTDSRE